MVDGVVSYISSSTFQSQPTTTSSSERMSPATKRGRYTVPVAARPKKVPVAKNVKQYVKACMDKIVETKYTNISIAQANIPTAGTVTGAVLCGITQGLTDGQRTGNHIRVRGIKYKGYFSDNTPSVGRLIILWDHQPNGAVPAFGEIISQGDTNGTYNHDTVVGHGGSRFVVLYDTRAAINPNIAATADIRLRSWDFKCNVPVTFDGSTGTVTDLVTNNLVFAYVASAASCDFNGYVDIEYTDA